MAIANQQQIIVVAPDALRVARRATDLFGWKILWHASSIYWGTRVVVDAGQSQIEIQSPAGGISKSGQGGHIRVETDDFATVAERVMKAGYLVSAPQGCSLANCFDFDDEDGIRFEVVSQHRLAA